MALFWRIWFSALLVNALVLTLFVVVLLFRFDLIYSELVRERLDAIAQRTGKPFEQAMSLGLPLASVRNTDAVLERARQSDPAILELAVIDASGRIVHSIGARGGQNDAFILTYLEASGNRARRKGLIIGSTSLRRADGEPAGSVAVLYSDQERTTRTLATAARLFIRLAIVQFLAAILGAALFLVLLRHQIRATDAVEKSIDDFERSMWRQAATDASSPAAVCGTGLQGDLEGAERQYQVASARIALAVNSGSRR